MKKIFSFLFVNILLLSAIQAQIRLPNVLGSNMVLQANKPITIWGWSSPQKTISIQFGTQQSVAQADEKGVWKTTLQAEKPSFEPRTLIISGDSTIVLNNILVGEVWLCSGQSNMEYPMSLLKNYAKPQKGIDSSAIDLTKQYPSIRLLTVDKKVNLTDISTKGWSEAAGEAMGKASAIGFYFAKQLQNTLNVPVGIISSSWGGSRIEPWTPLESYQSSPFFAKDLGETSKIDGSDIGKNYESMIAPLAPFSIKGILWYQGESNCMLNETIRYTEKSKLLIDAWRNKWADASLPFYFVQIAPYYYSKRKDKISHTNETLPEFWEAQALTLKIPNTGMVVVTDLVDNLADIHPSYKWEVGKRLSAIALAKDYGQKGIPYKNPHYKKMKVKKGKIILRFDEVQSFKTNDGKEPNWFQIAGEDGTFLKAKAEIQGNKIIVSNTEITKPKYVRFAWDETAMPNLVNESNLLVVPFRTNGLDWKH